MAFNIRRGLSAAGGALSQVGGNMMQYELAKLRDQRMAEVNQQRLNQTQGFTAGQNQLTRDAASDQNQINLAAQEKRSQRQIDARTEAAKIENTNRVGAAHLANENATSRAKDGYLQDQIMQDDRQFHALEMQKSKEGAAAANAMQKNQQHFDKAATTGRMIELKAFTHRIDVFGVFS